LRNITPDLPGCLEAIEQWHRHIENDHIWLQLLGQQHRLPSVFRFTHHGHILFRVNQRPKTLPNYGMIIRQKHFDCFHSA